MIQKPRLKSLRQKLPKYRLHKKGQSPAFVKERLRDLNENRGESPFLSSLVFALLESIPSNMRDIEYIHNRCRKDGDAFLLTSLPTLGKSLQVALSKGYWTSPASFAARGKGYAYPRFLSDLFSKIFEKDGKLRSDPCISSIKFIYQIAFFCYKADDGSVDPLLGAEKLEQLCATERELSLFDDEYFNDIADSRLIVMAKHVIDTLLSDKRCTLTGKPGPGAVADLKRDDSRFEAVVPYHYKYLHLINRSGLFFSPLDAGDRSHRFPCHTSDADKIRKAVTSKVVLVPKDSRGPRVIASEPWFLQFLQQGVKDWLVDVIEGHPLTQGHVNFADQTVNREMVRLGSVSKEWSSLDLKEASDRVTTSLVYTLFRGNPFFLKLLMDTRSEYTDTTSAYRELGLSGGKVIRLRKFAPMGSAMCFPILSLCCFAISVAAVSISANRGIDWAKEQVYVYGDDLVVGTTYAPIVIKALEICGLAVNKEKSFVNSHFLESCGVDCYNGHDIQPIRLKSIPSKYRKYDDTPDVIVSLCEKANLLLHAGYVSASEILFKKVESVVGPLPYKRRVDGILGRLVHPDAEDFVVEDNFIEERGIYKGRRRGYETWKAYATRPQPEELPTSGFGHLCRRRTQIGSSKPATKFGLFDLPKNSLLKAIQWKPEFPTSDWVPRPEIDLVSLRERDLAHSARSVDW